MELRAEGKSCAQLHLANDWDRRHPCLRELARECFGPGRLRFWGFLVMEINKFIPSIIFIFMATFLAYPQAQDQSYSDRPIKLSAELVLVDVAVSSRKDGRIVGGLKKGDFVIYEDGVKQNITNFSQDELPLSIVLLIDVSGSVQPIINRIRDGALEALRHLKPEDEVALMAFAGKAQLIQDFTVDRHLIVDSIEKINEVANVGRGPTLLHEGVYQAAIQLRKASNPFSRRAIIAITDDITHPPFWGHSGGDALETVVETSAVVCGLIVSRTLKIFIYPGLILGKTLLSAGSVNTYAKETGGIVLGAGKEDVEAKLTRLIDQLRTRYTLAYTPSNQKPDGRFRKIKVKVSPEVEKREGKLAVLARRGYYARQSSTASPRDAERQQTPR
jgi:VWFA-related protein